MDIFILRLLFLSFLVTCSLGFRSGSNFPTTKSDKKSFVDLRCIPKSTQPSSIAHLEDALLLQGPVMNGYGRGSKKLGVPTANLPHFDKEIRESALSNGVYFGWGYLPNEREILGCVVNIGRSPTFVDQENSVAIVEAHLLNRSNDSDFYGNILRLCLVTYIRPEKKFDSFDALISQINADISLGRELTASYDNLYNGREVAMKFFESTVNENESNNLLFRRAAILPRRK